MPSSSTLVQNIIENYIPTAVATMIEPMWILLNRLSCMLQPLEELKDCKAKSHQSIDTDYSSLPPQLVIWKAITSKHFVLAAVCAMALLANLLAIAFAGLFFQKSTEMLQSTTFQAPYELKFVSVNGSVGPWQESRKPSGAYHGGEGHDQFYIAESNYTKNASLPPWTDASMFYLPLFSEDDTSGVLNATHFEAETKSFGATMDCTQVKLGNKFEAGIRAGVGSVDVSIPSASGDVHCQNRGPFTVNKCNDERSALEMVLRLIPRGNGTQQATDVCRSTMILGWVRGPQGRCPLDIDVPYNDDNTLFLRCRQRLITGSAKIRVDASGLLQQPAKSVSLNDAFEDKSAALFSNDPVNIIAQSNIYFFREDKWGWHNDSFADDFMNHFMIRAANNSRRFVDPDQPVPKFEDVLGPLTGAYSKLFAIWLARNKKNLLIPITNKNGEGVVNGVGVRTEQRLFLSATMFIISEAILCTYVVVAIWVYARRPGRYLARLPTSIAAVIALFAASAAVQDMRGTSHLDKKGRAQQLKRIDARYGYGSFVGKDGRIHIGIEKAPFVRKSRVGTTWLERKLPLFRKALQA